ncbi:hypothetical protein ACSMXN_01875 [Jatrophihabitans sp. DSM 45814]
MIKLAGLLSLAGIIFWLWAIFDSVTSDKTRVRNLPKAAWVVLIIIFIELAPVAALAWVLFGRPRGGERPARPGGPTGGIFGGPNVGGAFGALRDRATGRPGGGSGGGSGGRSGGGRPVGPDDDPDFLRGI